MCGRLAQAITPHEISEKFGARVAGQLSLEMGEIRKRYNVAPSQRVLAVTVAEDGVRDLEPLKWGFVPRWSTRPDWGGTYPKSPRWPKRGDPIINARSEAVTNAYFGDAFGKRRCIIPATAFYEWQPVGKARQPFVIRRKDREPMALAGLWEEWRGEGQTLRTCAILTTTPNLIMEPIHDRMPVILTSEAVATWLTPTTPPSLLRALLAPCRSEELEAYPVAPTVGNPHVDDPSLLEPWQPSWSRKQ